MILILPFLLMQAWGWMLAQAMTVPWTDRPCLAHGVLVFQCHALCCLSSEAGAAQLLAFHASFVQVAGLGGQERPLCFSTATREHPLDARHCSGSWGVSDEENKIKSLPLSWQRRQEITKKSDVRWQWEQACGVLRCEDLLKGHLGRPSWEAQLAGSRSQPTRKRLLR